MTKGAPFYAAPFSFHAHIFLSNWCPTKSTTEPRNKLYSLRWQNKEENCICLIFECDFVYAGRLKTDHAQKYCIPWSANETRSIQVKFSTKRGLETYASFLMHLRPIRLVESVFKPSVGDHSEIKSCFLELAKRGKTYERKIAQEWAKSTTLEHACLKSSQATVNQQHAA